MEIDDHLRHPGFRDLTRTKTLNLNHPLQMSASKFSVWHALGQNYSSESLFLLMFMFPVFFGRFCHYSTFNILVRV